VEYFPSGGIFSGLLETCGQVFMRIKTIRPQFFAGMSEPSRRRDFSRQRNPYHNELQGATSISRHNLVGSCKAAMQVGLRAALSNTAQRLTTKEDWLRFREASSAHLFILWYQKGSLASIHGPRAVNIFHSPREALGEAVVHRANRRDCSYT